MGTKYEHLSCEECTMIQLGLEQGWTQRAIARCVQRAPSSISRELNRNGWSNPATAPKKRGRPPVAGGYRAPLAHVSGCLKPHKSGGDKWRRNLAASERKRARRPLSGKDRGADQKGGSSITTSY